MAKKPSNNDLIHDVLGRLVSSTDEIKKDVSSLKTTAVRHQAVLEEHVRRTEAAEAALEHMQSRLKPLETHVSMWGGAGKVLAVLGTVASIIAVLYKIFG